MGNFFRDREEDEERENSITEGPAPAVNAKNPNPSSSHTSAGATTEAIEPAAALWSSINQESRPKSSRREEFHPVFLKEFSAYLSLLEDKPEQGAQLTIPTMEADTVTEACIGEARTEEPENPSQTPGQPEIAAVSAQATEEPPQPQLQQQTEESFEILTWVKKAMGYHFIFERK